MEKNLQRATFGAGCFWGVEETFRTLPGVIETAVGYMGGEKANPTYEDVCTDETGHAEVVHLTYDPTKIKYEDLLKIFWENHDPTQIDRQGPDTGTQYRSVIFYHTSEQLDLAEQSKKELDESGKLADRVATQILPAKIFYPAEDYHQKYLMKRGLNVCH
jgi:peptide-methionine (S)-S-oxide reductase